MGVLQLYKAVEKCRAESVSPYAGLSSRSVASILSHNPDLAVSAEGDGIDREVVPGN
jgi:hypothetical protein